MRLASDPNRPRFEVEGIIAPGISDERQMTRRKLLGAVDSLGKALAGNPEFEKFDRAEDSAYEMMFGKARKLFEKAMRRRMGGLK